MRLIRLLCAVGVLTTCGLVSSTATAGMDASVQDLVKQSQSGSVSERQKARVEIEKALNVADEGERAQQVSSLIRGLPEQDYWAKYAVASALGRIVTTWTATSADDQKECEQILYKLLQAEDDRVLRSAYDRALMKAKGLYWETIDSYGRGNTEDAEVMFKHVFEEYPKSECAPRAEFFLGELYTRQYMTPTKGTTPSPELLTKAYDTWQDLIAKCQKGDYLKNAEKYDDAQYFLALNLVLQRKPQDAVERLHAFVPSPETSGEVYVWQFYPSAVASDIIDGYLPGVPLAAETAGYLEKHAQDPWADENTLKQFVSHLKTLRSLQPQQAAK